MSELRLALTRVATALGFLLLAVLAGGGVIYLLGDGEYGFFDTVYFAIITVASVGFWELPHLSDHAGARLVVVLLIVAGVGTIATFQSSLTALLVEGVIGKAFRRRRMDSKIAKLQGHMVVAGCGRTGRYVIQELHAIHTPFVVIDADEGALERLSAELGGTLLYVCGNATEDHTLVEAGVARARGVVAALTDDRDNLFVTLSARSLAPKARIVSKVVEAENEAKMVKAGADSTVSPHRIGGHRLASELVRPRVVEFLEELTRPTRQALRFEEVALPETPEFIGRTLRDIPIRDRTNLLVVALHLPSGEYLYNPRPDQVLERGVHLIVLGAPDSVIKLREMFEERGSRLPPEPS